jgi:NAD(P)-dependent dehydrogenase (short-subunit alcohol dehydrogenase family)
MRLLPAGTAIMLDLRLRPVLVLWTTDLKDRQIRVNAISPGTIDTPGLNELLVSGEAGEERKKMLTIAIPLADSAARMRSPRL